jgi:hypothetical protein
MKNFREEKKRGYQKLLKTKEFSFLEKKGMEFLGSNRFLENSYLDATLLDLYINLFMPLTQIGDFYKETFKY